MGRTLFWVSILVLGLSCSQTDPDFKFKSLDEFEGGVYHLREGAKIRVLSFSGGPECTEKRTYYLQFIGIDEDTKDTLRILAPCQTITTDGHPTEGSFSPWSKTSTIIDSAGKQFGLDNFENADTKKLVVFNKKNLYLEEKPYKTAIGTLGF